MGQAFTPTWSLYQMFSCAVSPRRVWQMLCWSVNCNGTSAGSGCCYWGQARSDTSCCLIVPFAMFRTVILTSLSLKVISDSLWTSLSCIWETLGWKVLSHTTQVFFFIGFCWHRLTLGRELKKFLYCTRATPPFSDRWHLALLRVF